MRGLNLSHEASVKGMVTISAGVATATPQTWRTPAVLIRNADEALYAAKANGRDRVEAYCPAEKMSSTNAAG